MDVAYDETEAILKKMERKIQKEYKQAEKEIQKKLEKHLERFAAKDADKRAALAAGDITQEQYNTWRQGQMMAGKRWADMRDTIANDYHKANELAKEIVRGNTPDIYALNHNYGTYEVEHAAKLDTSYTLYNRGTVVKLLRENPDLLPEPGKRTSERIAAGIDKRWNKQQIQSVMLQGILQGKSIPGLAKSLSETVGERNKAAAIRNARTMTTRAQNYGRLDSYKRAQGMGIQMRKQWVATLDNVTRDSHVDVDGEIVGVNEEFSNGLDCPGGMGPPEEVYNCRCAMIAQLAGFENDITDPEVRSWDALGDMSYDEWKEVHRNHSQTPNVARATDIFTFEGNVNGKITPDVVLNELETSSVGKHAVEYLEKNNIKPKLVYKPQNRTDRGQQWGDKIEIYMANIENKRVAAQTVIHEAAHHELKIGGSQLAEAICMAKEKMHLTGNDYLTKKEWDYVVNLAKKAYNDYPWKKGKVQDYGKYIKVID